MSISDFDLAMMQKRLAAARNPAQAKADAKAKAEKWQAGREAELQAEIERDAKRRGCVVLRPRTDKRATIREGWPDLSIFMPGGKTVFIEAKTEGGVVSEAQRQCHAELSALGYPVLVAWNLKDAIDFIILHIITTKP